MTPDDERRIADQELIVASIEHAMQITSTYGVDLLLLEAHNHPQDSSLIKWLRAVKRRLSLGQVGEVSPPSCAIE